MAGAQALPESIVVGATGIPVDELASLTAEGILAGGGERGKLGAECVDVFSYGLHGCCFVSRPYYRTSRKKKKEILKGKL